MGGTTLPLVQRCDIKYMLILIIVSSFYELRQKFDTVSALNAFFFCFVMQMHYGSLKIKDFIYLTVKNIFRKTKCKDIF